MELLNITSGTSGASPIYLSVLRYLSRVQKFNGCVTSCQERENWVRKFQERKLSVSSISSQEDSRDAGNKEGLMRRDFVPRIFLYFHALSKPCNFHDLKILCVHPHQVVVLYGVRQSFTRTWRLRPTPSSGPGCLWRLIGRLSPGPDEVQVSWPYTLIRSR